MLNAGSALRDVPKDPGWIYHVSGGNSYPYVELYITDVNRFRMMLTRKGEYTLYDMTVVVRDQNMVDALPLQKMMRESQANAIAAIESSDRRIPIGNLGNAGGGNNNMMVDLLDITIAADVESFSYVVRTVARNGSWFQQIGAKKINGAWQIASILDGNNVIDRIPQLSALFPKTQKGDPDFNAPPFGPRPPQQ